MQINCLKKFDLLIIVAVIAPTLALFSGMSPTPIFALLAIYPLIKMLKEKNFAFIYKENYAKIALAYIFYSAASIFWSVNPDDSIEQVLMFVLIFPLSMLIIQYYSTNYKVNNKKFFIALLCGISLVLIAANIETYTNLSLSKFIYDLKGKEYNSVNLNFSKLNQGLSYLAMMTWPVVAVCFVNGYRKTGIILFFLIFMTTIKLDNQSATLSLIASSVALIIVSYLGKKGLKLLSVFSIILIIFITMFVRFIDSEKAYEKVPNIANFAAEQRLYIWTYSAKRANEKPVLGWGINSSRHFPVPEKDYLHGYKPAIPMHPHNNVLQVWLESGYIGVALYLALIISIFTRIDKISKDDRARGLFAATFICYLIQGSVGIGVWQEWWLATAIISTILINTALNRQENSL